MNYVIKKSNLADLQDQIDFVLSRPNPEHSSPLAYDAVLKWSAILKSIEVSGVKPKRILDVGCGTAHTVALISEYFGELEKIVGLDLQVKRPCAINAALKNFTFVNDNFFEFERHLSDDYFDVVIDSCALTHFNPEHVLAHNDGLFKAGKIINRVLASGGIFVCASDILTTDTDARGEYVSPASLIGAIESGGLRLMGSFEPSREGQIINENFSHLTIGSFTFEKVVSI